MTRLSDTRLPGDVYLSNCGSRPRALPAPLSKSDPGWGQGASACPSRRAGADAPASPSLTQAPGSAELGARPRGGPPNPDPEEGATRLRSRGPKARVSPGAFGGTKVGRRADGQRRGQRRK